MQAEIQAAAKWWADQLRAPALHRSGVNKPEGYSGDIWYDVMANAESADMPPLDEAQIAAFEAALIERLPAFCVENNWRPADPGWGNRYLGVDYHPSGILKAAAEAVGLSLTGRLPSKSAMWIDPGEVRVARGYGQPPVSIYPPPEEPA